jgi:hypothetical protein
MSEESFRLLDELGGFNIIPRGQVNLPKVQKVSFMEAKHGVYTIYTVQLQIGEYTTYWLVGKKDHDRNHIEKEI